MNHELTVCILWALAAAGIGGYCALIATRITYITLADGRKQERRLPLLFKILLPLTPNFIPWFRKPSFAIPLEKANKRITAAGIHGLLTGEELFSLKILLPLVIGPFWFLLAAVALTSANVMFLKKIDWLIYLMGPIWLYIYPDRWIRLAILMRHNSIRRALPFLLDLLTLSVEAGMDFMTAMQRSVEKRVIDPLSEELLTVIREIQIGKTRREALRDMGTRVDMPELRSVVNALVQADELGVSIGSILRIQSDQMRQRRFERAEKLANEAPVKMLGPLLIIFIAVLLILLGPILSRVMSQGM